MGFIVKYEDLEQVGDYLDKKLPEWDGNFQDIENKFKIVAESDAFKGASADSVRNYIEDFHLSILATFSQLILLVRSKFLIYKDGYYQIDNQRSAYIVEENLEEVKNQYDNKLRWLYSDRDAVNSALAEVRDIFDRGWLNIDEAEDAYTQMMKNADTLKNEINRYENEHYNNAFKDIEDIINHLRTLINSQKGSSKIDISAYTKYDIANVNGFKDLINSLQVSSEHLDASQVDLENALARENYRQYIKRHQEAQDIKMLNTVLLVTTCVVATAIFPVGGIALLVTIGAATAISATVDNVADQYQEVGWGKIDWARSIRTGVIAGALTIVLGGIGGAIAGKIGMSTSVMSYFQSVGGAALFGKAFAASITKMAGRTIEAMRTGQYTHRNSAFITNNPYDPTPFVMDAMEDAMEVILTGGYSELKYTLDGGTKIINENLKPLNPDNDKRGVEVSESYHSRAAEIHNKIDETKELIDDKNIDKKDIDQFNVESNEKKIDINSSGAKQDINKYNVSELGKIGIGEPSSKQAINHFDVDSVERKVNVNKSDLHQDINSYNVDRETKEVEINKEDVFGQKINQYNIDNGERKIAVPFGKVFFANISNQKNVVTPKIFNPQAKAREALNRLYADMNSRKIEINKAGIDWRDRVKVGV